MYFPMKWKFLLLDFTQKLSDFSTLDFNNPNKYYIFLSSNRNLKLVVFWKISWYWFFISKDLYYHNYMIIEAFNWLFSCNAIYWNICVFVLKLSCGSKSKIYEGFTTFPRLPGVWHWDAHHLAAAANYYFSSCD